jgi:uncharacterized protein (TIGR03437 family)
MVKQIIIPVNVFPLTVTNTATVAGGGESNVSNDSASDPTVINAAGSAVSGTSIPAGIVNAASYVPVVAPGSIASVLGSQLSSGREISSTIPLPMVLASARFQIGGHTAPLFSATPTQVVLQIPWELAGQSQALVTGTVGAVTSKQQMAMVASFAPGLFTLYEAASSQGMIMIAGTQLVAAAPRGEDRRPVSAGEFIYIYCTGLGAVSNQPPTGSAALADPYSVTTTTPTVTIGGVPALLSFSRLVPGAVGLYQVSVQVPAGAPSGEAIPVVLSIGGVASNAVTIAVN